MVATAARKPISLLVTDVAGQNRFRASDISPDATVGELISNLPSRMGLVHQVRGKPIVYTARLNREGRQLNASERVGDALVEQDEIVLAPSIDAG